nr:hypothetical protein [Nakamurella panacisegetis]
MAAQADDHLRPDDPAAQSGGQVPLTQVQHVGPGRRGDVGAVVDGQ